MGQRLKSGNSVNVLHFPDILDALEMVRMRPRLMRVLNRHPKRVVLDLAETRQVKLAGLGILVDRLKRFGNGHSEIRFSNVSPQVHRTLIRAGVNGFLES